MTLYYGTVRVTLGEDNLLEEKITRVAAILPKLTGKSGILHMEDYVKGAETIIFTEDVPEEEEPSGTDDETQGASDEEEKQESEEDTDPDEE